MCRVDTACRCRSTEKRRSVASTPAGPGEKQQHSSTGELHLAQPPFGEIVICFITQNRTCTPPILWKITRLSLLKAGSVVVALSVVGASRFAQKLKWRFQKKKKKRENATGRWGRWTRSITTSAALLPLDGTDTGWPTGAEGKLGRPLRGVAGHTKGKQAKW